MFLLQKATPGVENNERIYGYYLKLNAYHHDSNTTTNVSNDC